MIRAKKQFIFTAVAAVILLLGMHSCQQDPWGDIDALKRKSNEQQDRIAALEALLAAQSSGDYVTGVTPLPNNEGYVIAFRNNDPITIRNGDNGDSQFLNVTDTSQNFVVFALNTTPPTYISMPKYKHREVYVDALIAHAGGMIAGCQYTNSLEALNLAYSKGARLFELDLIETSDGKIVAAHDWNHYTSITNYQGTIPMTEAEFMSQKIFRYFTPLNMTIINQWFAMHEDAILVTDKINDPQKIADNFLFKDRCIMELFSWDAVDRAIALGITPMPSENLVFVPNIETILEERHIEYITFGRGRIAGNEELLIRLKSQGIKAYVFHVNFVAGRDEQYVWDNEMDYCYGMYADRLDLLQK